MPLPLSFAWTTPPLVAGAKTVTRREWPPTHAIKYHAGAIVPAWSKQARFPGAEWVGQVTLTRSPYYEHISCEDVETLYVREGFKWLDDQWERIVHDPERPLWDITLGWHELDASYWVIEFPPAQVRRGMEDMFTTDLAIIDAVTSLCSIFSLKLGWLV